MAICYIKDRKTFVTKHMAQARYDMTLKSIYANEVTTITMPGTERDVAAGDFVFTDGFAGIVNEAETARAAITLTCTDIVTLFRRDMFPVTPGGTTEAFLKGRIDANYTNVADEVYRLPWLDVRALTSTADPPAPELDNGLWNIQAYIAYIRRVRGVFTDFAVEGDALRVNIGYRQPETHNVDLTMSDFETLEEVRNVTRVGRVTAWAQDTGAASDWYKLADGSITQTYTPDDRFEGAWAKIVVPKASDVRDAVMNEFAKNSYSHLVEFATRREYRFYDSIRLKTEGGQVLQSYITAVRKKSNDERTIYKTGELRVLLSEKLSIANDRR